jgi:hypothetical protein
MAFRCKVIEKNAKTTKNDDISWQNSKSSTRHHI